MKTRNTRVIKALEEWLIYVLEAKTSATPEMLEILPEIVEICLRYPSLVSPPCPKQESLKPNQQTNKRT